MGIAAVCRPGFLDDLCRSFPFVTPFYSLSYSRRAGRGMCVHMEGPSSAPETLRGPDTIGTCSPPVSRRRPKRAPYGRGYGLDEMLPYFNTATFYDLLTCIIGTPIYTIQQFTERPKRKAGHCLGQTLQLYTMRTCYVLSNRKVFLYPLT